MRSMQCRVWVAVMALAMGLLAVPAMAAPSALAAASVGPHAIEWQPSVAYEKLVLTVSGPDGQVLRREFAAGAAAAFEPVGADGKPLPDGVYTYELVASPVLDRATRRALANARRTGDESIVEKLRADGKLPRTPLTQSGSFAVSGGTIVPQDEREAPATGPRQATTSASASGLTPTVAEDQVIPDDLIVQGSLCVGFDCVNNENFGFDTIRLKENNLRIKFEDTSVGTFPTNDWQLTANDSASGGSSKFSIEDITGAKVPFTITAGASTNSIFVDSTGRVGFRTSTPVLDLHVATSNTPALRLEQNNSGGFTAQTWDIAGNEANFFVRDVTGGSRLPFRIRPGAATSTLDISADSEVGIGTASPGAKLHVFLGGTTAFSFNASTALGLQNNAAASDGVILSLIGGNGTSGNSQIALGDADNEFVGRIIYDHGTLNQMRFFTDNAVRMTLGNAASTNLITMSNGAVLTAGGTWQDVSSREHKENIHELSVAEAMETVMDLAPVKYTYKVNPRERHVGFIAEDVPDLVASLDRKGLSPMDIVAVVTKAVQGLAAQNQELRQENAELEARLKALERAISLVR